MFVTVGHFGTSLTFVGTPSGALYGATTLSIPTLSITTFCIMALSITGLFATLSIIDTEHLFYCNVECRYGKYHYAECHGAHSICFIAVLINTVLSKK